MPALIGRSNSDTPQRRVAQWTMLVAFGVFCFVFPFATFLLSFDLMPFGMEWMSSLLLAMLGLASAGWLWANYGNSGLAVAGGVVAVGLALEYLGVTTGVPFGHYRYTGVLLPELPGGVPLAIGFAWLLIITSGLFTARWLVEPFVKRQALVTILSIMLGAVLALSLDLLLEPVAAHVKGYWQWLTPEGEGYYGVPWSNFASWLVAALLMNLIVSLMLRRVALPRLRWMWLPVALYGMNVLMFGIVCLLHTYWAAGIIAIVIVLVLWLVGLAPRQAKRLAASSQRINRPAQK